MVDLRDRFSALFVLRPIRPLILTLIEGIDIDSGRTGFDTIDAVLSLKVLNLPLKGANGVILADVVLHLLEELLVETGAVETGIFIGIEGKFGFDGGDASMEFGFNFDGLVGVMLKPCGPGLGGLEHISGQIHLPNSI